MAKEKIVLAYSGGLDTSIIISWLLENYDCEVIAVCGDVGQGKETDGLEERALKAGASKLYIEDLRDEYVKDLIYPTLKAGAVYEDKYLLGTSHARPIIAKRLVEIALAEGATAICHGATGKGNDQVRFELTIKALAPQLKIIAPWRVWDIKSREDEIDYAQERNIEIPVTKEDLYSRDRNIWHISHEGMDLEDPANEPQLDNLLKLTVPPEKTPDTPCYIEIGFKNGEAVSLDGKNMQPRELVEALNKIGGEYGVGISDIVEDRLVGMKSRGVYETPGGTILYYALGELKHLCLDRDTYQFLSHVGIKFSELVYDGKWYTPLREGLSAFVDSVMEGVDGTVRLKLYKGCVSAAGAVSPNSLYNEDIASFGDSGELYSHKDSEGFINLFGLPLKVRALNKMRKK
ncbi:MAG: argininosuccinate synthase [Clostridia bacterium]|nr:argininosuccinate synthase [Clostridia bacterium]